MGKTVAFLYKLTFVFVFVFCLTVTGWSQNEHIATFFRAGPHDAETLTKAYLKPLPNGIGANLNTGWFNTASTHHTLGFDIQIRGALAAVPHSDQNFNVNNLNLENTTLAQGASSISPTAGGDNTTGPEVVVHDNGNEVAHFNLPKGSGFNYVPAPMIQATVGLIKHTDVILRFVPQIHAGSYGDINVEGFGLKHSLSQWLPGGKLFPVNIAIMAGYTRINLKSKLNLNPAPDAIPDPTYSGNYDNQKVKNTFDTFTAKLIVGKDLPFLSIYGAAGYETSTMNLDVTGDYPVPANTEGVKRTTTISNPFSYKEKGKNAFSFTGGVKFKLLFFHIFGDYTLAKYPVANAGIGFSFR